jgi:GntR family transcriptional regulator, carbon starvation induced regulator
LNFEILYVCINYGGLHKVVPAFSATRASHGKLAGRRRHMDEARTFAQAIQTRLAADILNGELPPGSRLRLQALCDTYQVSMSPLREALACLAGRNLVIQDSQRGFRVAPASTDDLRDVTESRIEVETTALRLSIKHGDDAWEAGILATHHRLSRRPRNSDLLVDETWEELHRGYHLALIAACGLPRLLGFCGVLHDHFDRYRRLAVLRARSHPHLKSSHSAIVKATLARDAERAQSLLSAHIRESTNQFIRLFGPDGLRGLDRAAD